MAIKHETGHQVVAETTPTRSGSAATTERPKIDQIFATKSARYWNEIIRGEEESGYDDGETLAYYQECKKELGQLSIPRPDTAPRPEETSIALSELVGRMSGWDPHIAENRSDNPDISKQSEELYRKTKVLYGDAARKIFPEVRGALDGESIVAAMKSVHEASPAFDVVKGTRTAAEYDRLLKEDPEQLAEILDAFSYEASQLAKSAASLSFGIDPKKAEYEPYSRERLAVVSKALYQLEQIRDLLRQHRFGRSDVTWDEEQQIVKLTERVR